MEKQKNVKRWVIGTLMSNYGLENFLKNKIKFLEQMLETDM